MFERNWSAVSHQAIVDELAGGSDAGFSGSGTSWYGLSQRLLGATDAVRRATSTIGATRNGVAADAAQGATRPLAPWIHDTEPLANGVGSVTYEQANNLKQVVQEMPPPRPPAQMPTDWTSVLQQSDGGAVGQSIAADMQDQARLADEQKAQQLMADYQHWSDLRTRSLTTGFPWPPPHSGPPNPPPPDPGRSDHGTGNAPGGDGNRPSDESAGGAGVSGADGTGGRPDGAPTRTQTITPPPDPPAPPPSGSPTGPGAPAAPGAPGTQGAPPPGVVPPVGAPSTGPNRPGGPSTRSVPRAGRCVAA